MNQTLAAIKQQLEQLAAQVMASVPSDEPFNIAHGNWTFPGLTRADLTNEARDLISRIDIIENADLGEHEIDLRDYTRRLDYLRQATVPQLWTGVSQAVPTYFLTLQGLAKLLDRVQPKTQQGDAAAKLRKLTRQLRSLEASLDALAPRATSLAAMIERIEQAYDAAEQLPTDLESLAEAQHKVAEFRQQAESATKEINLKRESATALNAELEHSAAEAKSVLQRCESAYSASTSVGLSAAFSERSGALSTSMWFWVGGLATALATGSYFGAGQLKSLSELIKTPDAAPSVIALNLLLSVLSVGAPVWFAWLATKQVGQRFRLAEDYAFKAAISRAYEGFRREAARFDKEMEAKLLNSALTRLDELPIRLVEADSHGSPWHELASSDSVKQAMKAIPGFAEQVKQLASNALSAVASAASKDRTPGA